MVINTREIEYKKKSNNTRITFDKLEDAADKLMAAQEKMHTYCSRTFKELMKNMINEHGTILEKVVNGLAQLDVNITSAKISLKYNYCRPIIYNHSTSFVQAKAMRHPIIERINDSVEYVPNDVNLGMKRPDNFKGGEATIAATTVEPINGMLLYGCNACGKSSFMKAVGLNVIMAQSGFFVPAEQFHLSPYDSIFTRISGDDDIFKGQSSFAVEMMELRNIFKRCNDRSLILGDELCKGTESTSALAIVAAGICYLHKKNTQFLFATHLHGLDEIAEIKALKTEVKSYHLSVQYNKQTGILIYDRLLKPGSGSSLYGLEVCKAMDMEPHFLKQANTIRKRIADQNETLLGDEKKSQYNSSIFMDVCQVCMDAWAEETHHIKYQKDADENNMVGHVPKNNKSNLVPLCKKCHKDETYGNIKIHGWEDTSVGRKLSWTDNKCYALNKKKKKLFTAIQMECILDYLKTYPKLTKIAMCDKINRENELEIKCSPYTLDKVRKFL
jgi:DNA mismatch repair protein MutS